MTRTFAALRLLWAHHKPTMILMATALVVALFFAVQFALDHRHWRARDADRPEIEGWMTLRYVAHAYHIPPEDLRGLLGDQAPQHRVSLQELAEQQGRPLADLIADLKALLPPPPPPPARP